MLWKVALLNHLVCCIQLHRWDIYIIALAFNFGKISIVNRQMLETSFLFLKYNWKIHRLRANTVIIQIELIYELMYLLFLFFLFFLCSELVTSKDKFLLVLLKQNNAYLCVADSYKRLNIQNMLISFFALHVCTDVFSGFWLLFA